MSKIISGQQALSEFEAAADMQAKATEAGDYKAANKCYKTIVNAVKYLKEAGQVGQLKRLLVDERVGVRLWAASYLLGTFADEAKLVLKNIAGGPGIHALTAETTLTEWAKGNLKM